MRSSFTFQGVSRAARKVLLFDVLNDPRYRRSILVDNMALAGAAGTLNNAFITADALAPRVCACDAGWPCRMLRRARAAASLADRCSALLRNTSTVIRKATRPQRCASVVADVCLFYGACVMHMGVTRIAPPIRVGVRARENM